VSSATERRGHERLTRARSAPTQVPDGAAERGEGRRRYLIFGIVAVALMMASVDQTIVATALGTLQRDLQADLNWSSWTITVYGLAQILVMPLAGSMSDQFGRRRIFVGAIGVFSVASLCCGLANNIYVLVLLRAVQAIGGGAFMPSATGIVSDTFGADRQRWLGLFSSIVPIGAVVGPVLGGLFVTYLSWRWIFLVNVPIGLVTAGLALLFLPDSRPHHGRRLDLMGVAMLGGGILGLLVGITAFGSGASIGSPVVDGSWLAGVALLAAFVSHASRHPAPLVPLRLLTGRGFAVTNLINFCFGITAFGFGALVPVYAEQRYGLSSLNAGTLLTARALGMIAVAALASFSLTRTGYRPPLMAGAFLCASGLVLMALRNPVWSPYLWLAASAAVMGIGMGVAFPAASIAALQLAPHNAAAVAGLRGMFRQLGGISGISVTAAILARSSNPGVAQAHLFMVMAGVLLAAIPLVLLVPDR